MTVLAIPLPFAGQGTVWVREHSGSDERVVDGTDTTAALALLDRLLVARSGAAAGPGQAAQLATADRDQVLASLCIATFGDRVDATRTCTRCKQPFDIEFRLSSLAQSVRESAPSAPPDAVYALDDGVRFRLPTGEDELAVGGLPADAAEARLLERCLVSGDPRRDGQRVTAAMAAAGPTLDIDLEATCTECGAREEVPFSIQAWLLGHVLEEQARLPRQVHLLARAYGWSLGEILSLSRRERLAFVALVEEERRASTRGRWS